MRVLLVHNAYQNFGGEDAVLHNEHSLLTEAGYEVDLLKVDNDAIVGAKEKIKAAIGTPYRWRGRKLVADHIARFRPDVVHVHNFFPLISPSLFDATAQAGVASVWTLHNFRVTCANGLLFRDGRPCELCLGKAPWPAVVHRCYRGSLLGSSVVASSIAFHNARGTWRNKVDRFIALNDFAASKFVEAGLPKDRIRIKPNFVPDPSVPRGARRSGAIFVGRLSEEKGLRVLIDAWRSVDQFLTIVGTGPLEAELRAQAPDNVRFTGALPAQKIASRLAESQFLVVPSLWYENFPMVLVEAFATGTPALVSGHGALASIVGDDERGLSFEAGCAKSLSSRAKSAFADEEALRRMGEAARSFYVSHLTPQSSLGALWEIYNEAIAERRAASLP